MSTIGVDLGTTWTAAAVLTEDSGDRPEPVMLTTRSMAMPSVVAIPGDGDGDGSRLVAGEEAEQLVVVDPTVGAREFKRRLGDETPFIVGGTPLGAEALMGGLLRATLDHPAVLAGGGERPDRVVLTHPANWGQYKLDLLAEVARLAGVDPDRVDLIAEPAAAAIAYAADGHLSVGDVAAVYDFGGGTFDAAVVRLEPSGPVILGEPEGLERLGGIDLDQAVLHHVDRALDGALAAADAADVEVRNALFRLRLECTRAKEALSDATEVSIPVSLPGLSTEVRLTRVEFESAIAPRLDDTFAALDRAVASTGTTMDELAGTLLVGGSSRLPLVAERLAAHTGRPVLMDADPKLAVAIGAAGRDRYAELAAASAANDGSADGDPSEEGSPERDSGPDGEKTGELPSPAALGASIKVDRPERPDPTEARKAKQRRTARRVAGGAAAAGAAAAATTVAAAAVANAGPLAGLGPLEGDFDLGDAVDDVAGATRAAFGFGGGDDDDRIDPTGDGAEPTAEDSRFDALRDLLGDNDGLDEFDEPAPVGADGFTVGGPGVPATAFAPGATPGPAPSMAAPAAAAPAMAAAPSAPPRPAPARPAARPEPQPASRPEPTPPAAPQAPAPSPTGSGVDPELEAVRAQLRDRLDGWEQPDGVDPEDAARLQRDLDGLLDRFQRSPGVDLDDAIADLRYRFEDRMRDFAQDQKLDALIEEEERETREQQELDDGVDAARATLREKLADWTPPNGADPTEAEALRADLADLLERYTPTPGQSIDQAIAELRDGFNDRVGDFSQDLRIDALIETVDGAESPDPDTDPEAEAEAETGADGQDPNGAPTDAEPAADDDPAAEGDDGELYDVFDDAENGDHEVHLTKEVRLDEEPAANEADDGATETASSADDSAESETTGDDETTAEDETTGDADDEDGDAIADADDPLYDDVVTAGIGTETVDDEPTEAEPAETAAADEPATDAGPDTGAEPATEPGDGRPAPDTPAPPAVETVPAFEPDPVEAFDPGPMPEPAAPMPAEPTPIEL